MRTQQFRRLLASILVTGLLLGVLSPVASATSVPQNDEPSTITATAQLNGEELLDSQGTDPNGEDALDSQGTDPDGEDALDGQGTEDLTGMTDEGPNIAEVPIETEESEREVELSELDKAIDQLLEFGNQEDMELVGIAPDPTPSNHSGISLFANSIWAFFISHKYHDDPSNASNYICYSNGNYGVNIHKAYNSSEDKEYWAYCLNLSKSSTTSKDYDYTITTLPSSPEYRIALYVLGMGYGSQNHSQLEKLFGYTLNTTEALQGTQAALWACQSVVNGNYSNLSQAFNYFSLNSANSSSDALNFAKALATAAYYHYSEGWSLSIGFGLYQLNENTQWERIVTLEENPRIPGTYQLPTDADGNAAATLTPGVTYKVVEEAAPTGVINIGWEQEFVIDEDDPDLSLSFTCEDKLPTGTIVLRKTDEETGLPLAGVEFTVTAKEDIVYTLGDNRYTVYQAGDEIGVITTAADGTASLDGLYYGTYEITETAGLADYKLLEDSFTAVVGAPEGYQGSTVYPDAAIAQVTYDGVATVYVYEEYHEAEYGKYLKDESGVVIRYDLVGDTYVQADDGAYAQVAYASVTNQAIHPDMAVAKLADRTTNPSGGAVAFDDDTGRYTEEKIPGTYYNGQTVTFTLTSTNTGDATLYNPYLVDIMSEEIWTVPMPTWLPATPITMRQLPSPPMPLRELSSPISIWAKS